MAFTDIIQGTRGAGNGLAANQKPDVWTALGLLKPYQTPATQFLFFGSKESKAVINKKGKFSWMEDEFLPHNSTTVAEITASGGDATLDASTVDNFAMFNVDDLVLVEDTDQMAIVSAVTSTTAVITGIGDDTITTIATATVIKIIASVNAEDALKREAYSTQEIEVDNYLTIMSETVSNTGRDQAGEAFTDGLSHAEQVQKKMEEMKFQFERIAMLSLTYGNAAAAGSMVKTWGRGLNGFITTNIVTYSSVTEDLFDAFLQRCAERGSPNRSLYAGSSVFYKIQGVIKDKVGTLAANQIVKKYGIDAVDYKYGPNNIKLIWDPVLDGKYVDHAFLVDDMTFKGRYMANDDFGSRKFRIQANVETPGQDTKDTKLLSDIGAQLMNEETAGHWLPQ